MGVQVRPVAEEEYAATGDLCVRAYRADGQLEGSYAAVLADVAGRVAHGEVLVAVDDQTGALVGCVMFVRPGSRYAEISQPDEAEFRMLAVDPSARGRGIGAELVRACLDRAAELGYRAVSICTRHINDVALRMYANLGFRRVPERDWAPRAGIILVALRFDLAPAG